VCRTQQQQRWRVAFPFLIAPAAARSILLFSVYLDGVQCFFSLYI
jgi:hypothetical protein